MPGFNQILPKKPFQLVSSLITVKTKMKMEKQMKLKCPHCGGAINVDSLMMQQFEKKFKEKAEQASLLKLREKEKVINDLKRQLHTAIKKAEQGSVQLTGEVQEQEIIRVLSELYPHDTINQSRKGSNAADVLQVVRLQNGVECGKIYFESKRTQSWASDWVEKLKSDNLKVNADILIIVSNALPKEIERYGMIDGVWVTNFEYFKELTMVLRYGIIKLHSVIINQQDKESKQAQLFKYFTSNEFRNVFESILIGFKHIQESHNSEKIKTLRMWKEREQIHEKILSNSIELYGSLKGIAASEIPEIKMFEPSKEN